jgi:hypothetical protein
MTSRQAALVFVSVLLLSASGCQPAQIGTHADTHKTVDALYTAVGGKRPDLVAQCEKKLQSLKVEGKVPEAAFASLTAVIAKTRNDQWPAAAAELHTFMKGQTQQPEPRKR